MTADIDRLKDLESVAEWAKTAMDRRELYECAKQHPDENRDGFCDRREALWQNVKSADAMLRASLKRLHDSSVKESNYAVQAGCE